LEYYILFCATTAIYTYFRVFLPVVTKLKFNNQDNHVFVRSPTIAAIVVMLAATVLAPFFFLAVLSETLRWTIIDGFYKGAQ
jgi:hypothetical protein